MNFNELSSKPSSFDSGRLKLNELLAKLCPFRHRKTQTVVALCKQLVHFRSYRSKSDLSQLKRSQAKFIRSNSERSGAERGSRGAKVIKSAFLTSARLPDYLLSSLLNSIYFRGAKKRFNERSFGLNSEVTQSIPRGLVGRAKNLLEEAEFCRLIWCLSEQKFKFWFQKLAIKLSLSVCHKVQAIFALLTNAASKLYGAHSTVTDWK